MIKRFLNKKSIFIVSVILFLFWIGGAFWFYHESHEVFDINNENNSNIQNKKTDVIVVLTGGSGRLEEGVRLLNEDPKDIFADIMFISGVHKDVTLKTLASRVYGIGKFLKNSKNIDRIILGHAAKNTYGNAVETKKFLQENDFESIRIVTSYYHMYRAMNEFKESIPAINIVPHPVYSDILGTPDSLRGVMLTLSEYHKFIYAILKRKLRNFFHSYKPQIETGIYLFDEIPNYSSLTLA